MEFVKHNQLLKIRVEYDQDYVQIGFNDFIEDYGLERLSDWEWLKFGNPEAIGCDGFSKWTTLYT